MNHGLTAYEIAVVQRAGEGDTAADTALHLHRSRSSVMDARKRARGKLGARTMAHAFALAFRMGLVE
jgi:DNA-binding CsgD family transcriptional regulator